MQIRTLFRSGQAVPAEYRANFVHLYLDIAWFGVLAASATAFVAVYAARLGANAFQIGLLSTGPAIVNLAFALPSGRWLEGQPVNSAVFWAAALHRFFYLLWIPLPWLLGPQGQIWALVGLALLMSIPGTVLAVGFNALFADAVPSQWRGHVAGVRNALLSLTFIVISLVCGQILSHLRFPIGYQVVFGIGFLGAAMSTFHLRFVVPLRERQTESRVRRGPSDLAWPGVLRTLGEGLRPGIALRFLVHRRRLHLLRGELLKSPFGKLVMVLFAFHLAIYLAVPLFPIHWVNRLHLTDQQIGLGTAAFYVCVFVGSTQLARLVQRLGNQRVTAAGAVLMSFYPAFMAPARGFELYLVGSVIGGLGWSLVGGAMTNYILDKVPEDHRPVYLAWYNLALNAALLLGSLLGPFVAGFVGVRIALAVFAFSRLLTALFILRWE